MRQTKSRAPAANRAVALRLYRLMMKKLEKLEKRMDSGGAVSAADSERETREIGAIVRNFEKMKALADDGTGKREGEERGWNLDANFARMRTEIVERLERLHRRRTADGSTSGTQ